MIDLSLVFDGTFASSGAPTGAALTVTRASTNVIDMLSARDVGADGMLEVHVQVLTAFTAAGAATLQIAYQTSPDNVTFVDLLLSPLLPVANLVLGVGIFRVYVPVIQQLDSGTPNRYHRLNYTVATGPMTAGALVAYMTGGNDRQSQTYYPANYAIGA